MESYSAMHWFCKQEAQLLMSNGAKVFPEAKQKKVSVNCVARKPFVYVHALASVQERGVRRNCLNYRLSRRSPIEQHLRRPLGEERPVGLDVRFELGISIEETGERHERLRERSYEVSVVKGRRAATPVNRLKSELIMELKA
jgi:hypothetical protein